MVMGGTCTHAVQKCVKRDFRVQDDFGGTVHYFTLGPELIELAESVMEQVSPQPYMGEWILYEMMTMNGWFLN